MKKLKLSTLRVNSFVTKKNAIAGKTVKGGITGVATCGGSTIGPDMCPTMLGGYGICRVTE